MAVTTQSVAQPVFSLVVLVSVLNLSPWMVGVDNHFSYCESVKTAVIPSVQSGLARLSHSRIASGDIQLSDSSLFVSYTCMLHLLLRHFTSAPFVLNLNPTALTLLPKISTHPN